MEVAAGRRVLGRGHITFDDELLASCAWVRHGRGCNQGAGVRVPRVCEQRVLAGNFDNAPQIHHRDAVADVLDHAEIMADEQVGEAELLLQVHHQVEHLGLHRDVER